MNKLKKWAVLGKGNTGSKVIEELKAQTGIDSQVFCSKNPPTSKNLNDCQGIIAFVPSNVLMRYVPLFIEKKIKLVSGATGLSWSNEIISQLENNNLPWVSGSNFSLGMRAIHQILGTLKRASNLFDDVDIEIHEVHHTKKLDAPSGTALRWKEWVENDKEIHITHERKGDVIGDHQLTFNAGDEKITIRHEALNRSIFAKGAIWAAKYIEENNLPAGLHYFENITKKYIDHD